LLLHVRPLKSAVIKNILLKHFANAKYILSQDMLSIQLDKACIEEKPSVSSLSEEAQKILSKTHDDVLSAQDYVQSTAISLMPKIDALEALNEETDSAILAFEKEPSKQRLAIIYENLQEYADVLAELMAFEHLGFAVQTLINFLSTLTEDQFENDKIRKLATMLVNLLSDLASWRENVFITQVARDIHYLDSSLLSSCLQIEAIFEEKGSVTDDDEIEFF